MPVQNPLFPQRVAVRRHLGPGFPHNFDVFFLGVLGGKGREIIFEEDQANHVFEQLPVGAVLEAQLLHRLLRTGNGSRAVADLGQGLAGQLGVVPYAGVAPLVAAGAVYRQVVAR